MWDWGSTPYLIIGLPTVVDPMLGVDIPPEIPPRLLRPPSVEEEVSTLQEVETRMGHSLVFFRYPEAFFHATNVVCVAFYIPYTYP